jgi:hypothetical protein
MLDYPESPVKLNCIKGPLHFHIQSAGSIVVNMTYRRAKYWRLMGLFILFIGRVTRVVMTRKSEVRQGNRTEYHIQTKCLGLSMMLL